VEYRHLEQAVEVLERRGPPIAADCLPQLSPLGWEHINLRAIYIWDLRQTTPFAEAAVASAAHP
jgi:hypothetical protein